MINGVTYKVEDVWRDFVHCDNNLIHYGTDHPFEDWFGNTILSRWRADIAKAEVIHRA